MSVYIECNSCMKREMYGATSLPWSKVIKDLCPIFLLLAAKGDSFLYVSRSSLQLDILTQTFNLLIFILFGCKDLLLF